MVSIFTSDNWRADKDSNEIVWLKLDKKDESANTLSKNILEELSTAIDRIKDDIKKANPKGLVIMSAKESGFIAGADIKEFTSISNKDEAYALIRRGQNVMDKIESLPLTTIAMIHGFCLGGGLELALACDYRVADDSTATKLGLPEVLLGIHPGFGGTVRLPKLIGTGYAMDLILSGRIINVQWAKKIGLVNVTVPFRHLEKAATAIITKPPKRKKPSFRMKLLDKPIIKGFVKSSLHKKVEERAPLIHYPAPHNAIDIWAKGGSFSHMMEEEAKSVAELITGDTAKNLIRLFFLRERLKGLGKVKGGEETFKPRHVHVIGAGVMGGDIASWCVLQGMTVTLQDREAKFIAPAIERAYGLFKHKFKHQREITDAMDRLIPDNGGKIGVHNADVVIEAIFENLEAKQSLFKEIEKKVKKETVLASNTSSIPIENIASVLEDPARLVGIHFFNPVSRMPLVEIVSGPETKEDVIHNASIFTNLIGKLPLPVKSTPGFLVNRVLMPYLLEAVTMIDEGIDGEVIDKAATDFGMPMGPILLADTVGLDICLHVAEVLADKTGEDTVIPESLKKKVEAGELGRKTGKGYYTYRSGHKVQSGRKVNTVDPNIAERLILSMVNEASHSLKDEVAGDADMIDAGMVFGTGFAPFRGGPLNYLKDRGVEEVEAKLQELKKLYGNRFAPNSGLKM